MYKNRDGDIVEAKDGFYDPSDGSIHVDLNADNVLFTVSHELVHFIRDWSPKQFKKLADLVMKGFNRQNVSAEELILAKQAEYAESDIQLTEEQAFEEVIAASLEGIMADGRVMELMREAEAKDKGLGAKLRQFFQDIGRMIRDTISSYKDAVPGSPEGRLIRKMEDLYSQLQEAFAEGVMDAGENFQNAENTTGEGGVRYLTPKKPGLTFKTGQNAKGEFLTNVLIDLADEQWWTGSHNYAILSMSLRDTTEFTQFYQEIKKRTKDMDEYGVSNNPVVEDAFIVRDRYGKEYLYRVSLDGYLHGVVIAKIDMAKYKSYVKKYGRSNNYGRTSANTIRRVSGARAKLGRNGSSGRGHGSPNGNFGSSGVASSSPHSSNGSNYNQGKSTYQKVPSTADSDGNQLTSGQQTYFAASKERDTNGNLQVMYRGDSEEVTVYDRKKSKPSNLHGRGFYYTNVKSHAGQYGIVRAFYLNTVDPLMPGQHKITKDQMLRFLEAIENDGEDYDLYNYGEGATAQSVLETVWGKGDFEMLQDVSASAIGDLVAVVELFNEINGTTYDSIRLPTETVIFNSNQAKLTTNKNPTDHPDIRYSIGSKTDGAVQALLEKENDALREDVARLKELLKLQGTQTHGTRFTASSVEAAARMLKKNAGAKGNTKELAKLLNGFYEYIATGELTWEDVREQARPIANWLMDHVVHSRSDYAQEVLDQIHGSRVHLDEGQIAEAAYFYGSYNGYRKALAGVITISKEEKMPLEVWWQEMAGMYPYLFDESLPTTDMPRELFDIVNRMRNENSSALEYEYNRRWIEQDLIRDVYDSYWRVNNLRTVADRYAAKRKRLISEHYQRVNQLKADNRQKVEQLREQHQAEVEMVRKAYRQQLDNQKKALAKRIATPVCALVRNDNSYRRNSKSLHISVEALCSRYLTFRVGKVLSCRPQVSGGE